MGELGGAEELKQYILVNGIGAEFMIGTSSKEKLSFIKWVWTH